MNRYHITYLALFGEIPPDPVIRTDLQEWALNAPSMRFVDFLQKYYRYSLAETYSTN